MTSSELQQTMRTAMQLMRGGDLAAATAALQHKLGSLRPATHTAQDAGRCIEGVGRVVANDDDPAPRTAEAATESPQIPQSGTFACAHGTRDYLMYAPQTSGTQPPPLLLMLHGCTQDAADFARGTRMHAKAASEGYVVVYPSQSLRDNANRCWNWFRPTDQQRGRGEPAWLAAFVADIVGRVEADPARIYVAGLSSGGAMALTAAHLYPDVFRGVAAHSALPFACAHDVPSALAAMRSGPATSSAGTANASVPKIVFHGDRDATVNVRNAVRIFDDGTAGRPRESRSITAARGGYDCTLTTAQDPDGKAASELWIVHGAAHAWFGGSRTGSHTDERAPDSSAEMLRFFGKL